MCHELFLLTSDLHDIVVGEIVMLAMQLDAGAAQPMMLSWMQRDVTAGKGQLSALMGGLGGLGL